GVGRSAFVGRGAPGRAGGGCVGGCVRRGTGGGSRGRRGREGGAVGGGTSWVVGGRGSGFGGGAAGGGGGGVLVVRRVRVLDPVPRGRGGLRDALAAKSTELFGARAPIVNALVFAPNVRLDSGIRERYVRSGLPHLPSISGP